MGRCSIIGRVTWRTVTRRTESRSICSRARTARHALRADFSGVDAVTLSVTGTGDSPFSQLDNVPVSGPDAEVFWATPAAVVRRMPSMRLQLTLASAGATPAELGTYVLDHSASTLPA